MSKLVIFGAGDAAVMAHYYFTHDSEHEVLAFAVDMQYRQADSLLGLPLIDFEAIAERFPPDDFKMFIGIGYAKMNRVRAEKYHRAKEFGYELVSYISSRCSFLTDHPIGDNCFVMEDNTIQPFVRIGNNVTMWSGNHIGHHSVIEDHCFLTSHVVVAGHVHIRPYCFMGINATLRDHITVAPETLIGAGAIVMEDTVEKGVYLPERARLSAKKSDEIDL